MEERSWLTQNAGKCDETHPECGKCKKQGRECVYAADPVFRNMNQWSKKSVQTRVAQNAARSNASHSPSSLVSLDYAANAIGPFFDHFIKHPDYLESTRGFLPELPSKYASLPSSSYLAQAVNACALSHMANVSKLTHLELKASECYGDSLRSLNNAMQTSTTAASDDSLYTIMLLALYEVRQTADLLWRDTMDADLCRARPSQATSP